MAGCRVQIDGCRTATADMQRDGSMDPLATLFIALGTLVIIDFAALQLGGSHRPRPRVRPARPR